MAFEHKCIHVIEKINKRKDFRKETMQTCSAINYIIRNNSLEQLISFPLFPLDISLFGFC